MTVSESSESGETMITRDQGMRLYHYAYMMGPMSTVEYVMRLLFHVAALLLVLWLLCWR